MHAWEQECDEYEWTYFNIKCYVKRDKKSGVLVGYVYLPLFNACRLMLKRRLKQELSFFCTARDNISIGRFVFKNKIGTYITFRYDNALFDYLPFVSAENHLYYSYKDFEFIKRVCNRIAMYIKFSRKICNSYEREEPNDFSKALQCDRVAQSWAGELLNSKIRGRFGFDD